MSIHGTNQQSSCSLKTDLNEFPELPQKLSYILKALEKKVVHILNKHVTPLHSQLKTSMEAIKSQVEIIKATSNPEVLEKYQFVFDQINSCLQNTALQLSNYQDIPAELEYMHAQVDGMLSLPLAKLSNPFYQIRLKTFIGVAQDIKRCMHSISERILEQKAEKLLNNISKLKEKERSEQAGMTEEAVEHNAYKAELLKIEKQINKVWKAVLRHKSRFKTKRPLQLAQIKVQVIDFKTRVSPQDLPEYEFAISKIEDDIKQLQDRLR